MTLDEFIRRELETSGKTLYTLDDVARLAEQWIEMKKHEAPPFEGWRSDAEVDALLGIGQEDSHANR